jgi:hypothetical protein
MRTLHARTTLLGLAVAVVALSAAGGASRADPAPGLHASATDTAAALGPPLRDVRVDSDASTYSACAAPSVLRLHGPDDVSVIDDLASCSPDDAWARVANRDQTASQHCEAAPAVAAARVLEGALPLDAATVAHVRAVFRAGQALGRRRDMFGLIGDSMTLDSSFLRPFRRLFEAALPERQEVGVAAPTERVGGAAVPAELRAALPLGELSPESLVAPRAAKVGVRATWPMIPRLDGSTPLDEMVTAVSPAYAVVLYGANDALWRTDSVDLLVRGFDAALSAIADALEARGIVLILTTIPKHMRERGWPDCGLGPTGAGNERFAMQATVLSARVADLACRRHLPLIDLRWSLEPLVYHGIGPDGVHLSVHPDGGGVLDASGLACGHNAQNLVTLRELRRVVDAATW